MSRGNHSSDRTQFWRMTHKQVCHVSAAQVLHSGGHRVTPILMTCQLILSALLSNTNILCLPSVVSQQLWLTDKYYCKQIWTAVVTLTVTLNNESMTLTLRQAIQRIRLSYCIILTHAWRDTNVSIIYLATLGNYHYIIIFKLLLLILSSWYTR